jgi:hypothetical protein
MRDIHMRRRLGAERKNESWLDADWNERSRRTNLVKPWLIESCDPLSVKKGRLFQFLIRGEVELKVVVNEKERKWKEKEPKVRRRKIHGMGGWVYLEFRKEKKCG